MSRCTARSDQPAAETVEERLAFAAACSPAARQRVQDEVVVSQLPLARSIALRYRDRGESIDDLMQVASMALVMAVRRYRPGVGVCFAAFAVPTVTGELRRHFRDRGWDVRPPRRLQELRARVQAATAELAQAEGRTPSTRRIAEHLGVQHREVLETLAASQGYHSTSLDLPAPQHPEAARLGDTIGQEDPCLDRIVDTLSLRPLLAGLAERDRHVLCLRYYRGCTQQQIADEIGVTQMQVSRLINQALRRLRTAAEAVDAA